jgi:uroporphyrinogen decarboxylase
MTPLFIQTLKGRKTNPPPVWLMRQAGRYLPEYRTLRATTSGFMEMALNPTLAAAITMQPIQRYPHLDAAIIFSDILVIPYAMGMDLQFIKGEGPVMPALDTVEQDLEFLPERLEPVYAAIEQVRDELTPDKALIGFAGSPWTVACYMIAGSNHDEFSAARAWAFSDPQRLDDLINVITDATVHYLLAQIKAGADAVQLFDSWAGLLAGHGEEFERFILRPTQNIVSRIRRWHPHLPIIGFPRQAGGQLERYAQIDGLDGLGLDWSVDITWAAQHLPQHLTLQGNLDPLVLVAGGAVLQRKTALILEAMQHRPFIFNLGHGIVPQTPPEHIEALLNQIKGV